MWHKQLLFSYTICFHGADCSLSRKVFWDVCLSRLCSCTGIKSVFSTYTEWSFLCVGLYYYFLYKDIFLLYLVGDNRVPLSLCPVTCIHLHHVSYDWILLVSLQGFLVLLHILVHIDVLHLFGNAACGIDTKLSGSCYSTVRILHDI